MTKTATELQWVAMFRPSHFAANHFSPKHFVGRAAVVIVVTDGAIRGGIAPALQFHDIVNELVRDDEEILMIVVSFIEVL